MEAVLPNSDHDTLIRLETKFDAFAQEVRQQNVEFTKIVGDHEARLRLNESALTRVGTQIKTATTVASLVGGIIGFVASTAIGIAGFFRH